MPIGQFIFGTWTAFDDLYMDSKQDPQNDTRPTKDSHRRCCELAEAWHERGLRAQSEACAALLAATMYLDTSLELMHQLQRERGASCLYLGAKGANHRAILETLRSATDAYQHQFLASLPSPLEPDAAPRHREGFRQAQLLATLLRGLAQLTEKRDEIVRCQTLGKLAHTFYTELLGQLLAFIFSTSDSLPAASAMPIYAALYYLAEAKELAGQERAWGSLCLAAGTVTGKDIEQLGDLIEMQEQNLRVFEQLTGSFLSQLSIFQQRGDDFGIEKMRRQMAMASSQSSARLPEPGEWFETATRRMDSWRKLEQELLQKLKEDCRSELHHAPPLPSSYSRAQSAQPGQSPMMSGSVQDMPQAVAGSLAEMLTNQARRIRELDEQLTTAQRALEGRKVVDRAKGLLMKHRGMNEPEAHRFLRDEAMRRGRKITDLAALFLESSELWNPS